MGLSTYLPRRTLLDWPADVTALVDALGIDRFAALGWSAGGAYAVACAYALADRVTGIALLSSAAPFEVIGTRKGLGGADRILLVLCRWAPPLAALTLEGAVVRPPANVLRSTVAKGMTPRDMEALDRAGPPEVSLEFVRESCRSGTRGVIRDYRVFGDPWGFALEDVTVPTTVWEGTEDTTGPPTLLGHVGRAHPGRHLAPGARGGPPVAPPQPRRGHPHLAARPVALSGRVSLRGRVRPRGRGAPPRWPGGTSGRRRSCGASARSGPRRGRPGPGSPAPRPRSDRPTSPRPARRVRRPRPA